MPRPWLINHNIYAKFAVATAIMVLSVPCLGAEADEKLSVARDNEKTVYSIECSRGEDNQDTVKAWDMLQGLRIDSWREKDGKRPDSDRRGRGEHP